MLSRCLAKTNTLKGNFRVISPSRLVVTTKKLWRRFNQSGNAKTDPKGEGEGERRSLDFLVMRAAEAALWTQGGC